MSKYLEKAMKRNRLKGWRLLWEAKKYFELANSQEKAIKEAKARAEGGES